MLGGVGALNVWCNAAFAEESDLIELVLGKVGDSGLADLDVGAFDDRLAQVGEAFSHQLGVVAEALDDDGCTECGDALDPWVRVGLFDFFEDREGVRVGEAGEGHADGGQQCAVEVVGNDRLADGFRPVIPSDLGGALGRGEFLDHDQQPGGGFKGPFFVQ